VNSKGWEAFQMCAFLCNAITVLAKSPAVTVVNMVVAHIEANGLSLETDRWGRARGERRGFRQQPRVVTT